MAHDKQTEQSQQSRALFSQEAPATATDCKKAICSDSSETNSSEVTKSGETGGAASPQVTRSPVPKPRRALKQRTASEKPPIPTPRTKTPEMTRRLLSNNQVSPSPPRSPLVSSQSAVAALKKPPPPMSPKPRRVHRPLKETAHSQSSEDLTQEVSPTISSRGEKSVQPPQHHSVSADTKSHTASSDHPKEVARDTEQFYDNFVVCDKAIEKSKTLSFSAKIKSVVVTLAGIQSDSNATDFSGICRKSYKFLQKLCSKYKEEIVSSSVWMSIEETKRVLDQKDICISVFGQHNCGKSTFLNALIGDLMLPVYPMSETSVKVKIQHDSSIHLGVCSPKCSQTTAHCPRLLTGKEAIVGQESIHTYLKDLNKKIRSKQEKWAGRSGYEGAKGPHTLKVCIPLLAKKVPHGWTVSLVDNPGFGEAKEHVTQIADASLVSSSAYIYLLQTESIGGKDALEFFKELSQKDQGAITDGRLTVGITKFDRIKSEGASSDEVRAITLQTIEEATGLKISKDMIIPMSSNWAMDCRKLDNSLKRDPHIKANERELEKVLSRLEENHSQLDIPFGQGESIKDALRSRFDPSELVQMLESVSGTAALKDRIDYVIGNACVKMWATKLQTQFMNYLEDAKKKLKSKHEAMTLEKKEKEKDHRLARGTQKAIAAKREEIQRTLVKGKSKVQTPLWKRFEESYKLDLENSKPQESGKERVKVLVTEFINNCKEKIDGKKLGPQEFEAGLREFLDVSATKLQQEFDKVCGFFNTHNLLCERSIWAVREMELLCSLTREFCHISTHSTNAGDRGNREDKKDERPLTAPNLGDIKMKVKIPKVSLSWWQKIIDFFRRLRKPRSESGEDIFSVDSTSDTDNLSESSDHTTSIIVDGNQSDTSHSGQTFLYKKWTPELEETVANVQQQMEKVCDEYFQDIQHKAIKYFYNTYYRETEALLKGFDTEFGEPLNKEDKKLNKLQKEIVSLTEALKEMKERMKELNDLKELIWKSYTSEFCKQL